MTHLSGNAWSFSIPEPSDGWSAHGGDTLFYQVRCQDQTGNLGISQEKKIAVLDRTFPWNITMTANNATIAVPAAINPTLDGQPLKSGDAIGVFYLKNSVLYCGGYCIWHAGESTAITAFGLEGPPTNLPGFADGEFINFRIWDSASGNEYSASAIYSMGGPDYSTGAIMVLASLAGQSHVTHNISLPAGWSMISSYVAPQNPAVNSMLASIVDCLDHHEKWAGASLLAIAGN